MADHYYTYILECADGSLYTGYTTDLARRVRTHNSGRGAKYTRSRLPAALVYFETFETRHDAMHREAEIKKLSRARKDQLIQAGRIKAASPDGRPLPSGTKTDPSGGPLSGAVPDAGTDGQPDLKRQ